MVYEGSNCLGNYFLSSREKGVEGLPLMSVTLRKGLIHRSDLDRRTETNIKASDHLLVRKGDIAYNMMRVWQGALGRADYEGIVSPAYIVLRPNKNIDSRYAEYLFNTPRIIYLFWAYSYGLTKDRLRLYFNDFKSIPVEILSLPEQSKVAKILSTWDQAIEVTEKLISSSEKQKKSLMQKLLTRKKRLHEFNDEWSEFLLSDLGSTYSGLSGKTKSDFGKGSPFIPYMNIFSNSRIKINDFDLVDIKKQERQHKAIYGDIFFTTSSETPEEVGMSSVLLDDVDDLYLNSFCFGFRLNDFENILPEFAQYYLRGQDVRRHISVLAQGATRYNLSKTQLMKLKLRLPPIIEQQEIALVLSAADKETEALQQKLNFLKQEKKALMQQLLTGKRRVIVDEIDLKGDVA